MSTTIHLTSGMSIWYKPRKIFWYRLVYRPNSHSNWPLFRNNLMIENKSFDALLVHILIHFSEFEINISAYSLVLTACWTWLNFALIWFFSAFCNILHWSWIISTRTEISEDLKISWEESWWVISIGGISLSMSSSAVRT